MHSPQETILRELSTLPEDQANQVLDFIRFLKMRSLTDEELSRSFREALTKARDIATEQGISEADIAEEIRQVRLAKP
jgi:hypothetical protein